MSIPQVDIFVQDLVKRYGQFPVFDGLSLVVKKGSCTGLVGPNGSGKTTLFNCLLGFTDVSFGQVSLFGYQTIMNGHVNHRNLEFCRKQIGFVPEETVFYEHLSPKEYLQLVASVLRLPSKTQSLRVESLLRMFNLERWTENMITTLSEGNRQRLSIAAAFLQGPDLLLLDEPLNGLDPGGRHQCLQLMSRFIAEGISELNFSPHGTIFVSSHLLGDIERICTNIIILNHECRVVAHGSLFEVRNRLTEDASLEDVYLAVVEGKEEEE